MPLSAEQPRVLLVDDDPMMHRIVSAMLAGTAEVVSAWMGDEALSILAADTRISVVLSDLTMPGVFAGPDFLARVYELNRDLVAIALTSDDSAHTILDAINRGHVFRYIVKPVQREPLVNAVRAAFDQYRMLTGDRVLMEAKVSEMSRQLLQAERLATLGGLAAGVGHELNNIAQALAIALDELADQQMRGVPVDDDTMSALERVANHVTTHGRFLLHLGKPRGDAVTSVDLVNTAESVVKMLAGLGRAKHVDLRCESPDGPLDITANHTRLEQVITNLVLNAADASVGIKDRRPTITLRMTARDGRAELQVADTASGIAPEHLARIFDPYFTTKGTEKGTGLGLAVVRQIVEAFEGTIEVESTLGVGTTFTLSWPLRATGATAAEATTAPAVARAS